jgi:uncharacterized protein (UPF0332 family)
MTAENKGLNITEELERAKSALESADLLNGHGHVNDAVSRLYYCLLYHIRAVLLVKSFEPKNHESALRLFSLHFVKTGLFEPAAAHLFSRLMKYREEADYNPSYVFAQDEYLHLRTEVDALMGLIRGFLQAQGFIR